MEVEVAQASDLRLDGSKVQARVNGRYVSIFNVKGELYCIDAICYHAGGPLTVGDIEDVDGKVSGSCSPPGHGAWPHALLVLARCFFRLNRARFLCPWWSI
mmetsp:Transcript_13894/g.39195  ORF Transcript_13894/g.39195 Transcript_13894/m.39195 type:complete len:101 (+) Transcript_13894:353-655(+)